ncbi:HlyD family efflux transporter periplasmic adaptor subunit [Maribrevibacterium harenarium]|uniref:HlyD family efflux transporter periplasmic adaptor subunit n=1 Tax=Maribrevibacterium harenarium TaxID=2589817 RepID=A0A501W7W1_9GAMM|nr:HlyD family efflux transporter periplasmic adaptor subunit [Maribrevibacterium harenarium]TPE45679.1 HlyD family efflux transporter periplasmic adaptor subunit [Maribrevibacterium harenarium]
MGSIRILAAVTFALLGLTGCTSEAPPQALGTIEKDAVSVRAPVTETIVAINVAQGDQVAAGDILLTLDKEQIDLQLEQGIASRDVAQAQLALLLAGTRPEQIAAAEARYQAAQANTRAADLDWQRIKELYSKKVTGKAELDASKARLDAAHANQNAAYQQWQEAINGPTKEQIAQAQANATLAEVSINQILSQKDRYSVKAPVDGQVETLPWHVGDDVTLNAALVQIIPANTSPYARLYIPATMLQQIKVGTPLILKVDGIPEPISGTVRFIRDTPAFTPYYAMNAEERDRLMYLTEVDINTDQHLPAGVGVQAQLP